MSQSGILIVLPALKFGTKRGVVFLLSHSSESHRLKAGQSEIQACNCKLTDRVIIKRCLVYD